MSFHHTARNIKIGHEGGVTTLEAELRDKHGDYHHRKIRLDDHIGNTDGMPSLLFPLVPSITCV